MLSDEFALLIVKNLVINILYLNPLYQVFNPIHTGPSKDNEINFVLLFTISKRGPIPRLADLGLTKGDWYIEVVAW